LKLPGRTIGNSSRIFGSCLARRLRNSRAFNLQRFAMILTHTKDVFMNDCGAVPNKRSASLICGGSTTLKNAVEMMLPEQDRRSQQRSIHSFSCPYSQTSWYRNSANFACREFSEVLTRKVASRPPLGALFLLAILAFLSKAHRQQEFVPTSTRPRPPPATRTVVCRQPHRRGLVLP
jgi:hypothetical protein